MTVMVQVPRELLRRVLEDASDDAYTASSRGYTARQAAECLAKEARIAELRKAAGLDNPPDNG